MAGYCVASLLAMGTLVAGFGLRLSEVGQLAASPDQVPHGWAALMLLEGLGLAGMGAGALLVPAVVGESVATYFAPRRLGAGGSWKRYGAASRYRSLTTALRTQSRSLAPDLLIVAPGEAAFVVECKYSADADYVGRTGLAQTLLYLTDVGATMAPVVEGVVVAPDGVVGGAAWVTTPAGRLGLATPSAGVARAVEFMRGA